MASDRKPFHRTCVKCFNCRIPWVQFFSNFAIPIWGNTIFNLLTAWTPELWMSTKSSCSVMYVTRKSLTLPTSQWKIMEASSRPRILKGIPQLWAGWSSSWIYQDTWTRRKTEDLEESKKTFPKSNKSKNVWKSQFSTEVLKFGHFVRNVRFIG